MCLDSRSWTIVYLENFRKGAGLFFQELPIKMGGGFIQLHRCAVRECCSGANRWGGVFFGFNSRPWTIDYMVRILLLRRHMARAIDRRGKKWSLVILGFVLP